jgi:hypothetical protein
VGEVVEFGVGGATGGFQIAASSGRQFLNFVDLAIDDFQQLV